MALRHVMPVCGADATFVVGRLGRIEEVNDAACILLGYSREEIFRLHGSQLVLPEDQVRVGLSVDQMQRGEVELRRGRLVRKDGSVIVVEVTARPLPARRVALTVRPLTSDGTSTPE